VIERLVADGGVGAGDEVEERGGHGLER
jgi:hypothetical protein